MGVIVFKSKEDFLKMVNEESKQSQPHIKEPSTQYIKWGLSTADRELLQLLTERGERAAKERHQMKLVDRNIGVNIKCRDCARLTKDETCARGLNVMNIDYVRDCNWFMSNPKLKFGNESK